MTSRISNEVSDVVRVGAFIARFQQARDIGPDHLLLAIMSDSNSRWANLVEERGVGTYATVARVGGNLPSPQAVDRVRRPPRYVRPMRRVIVDLLVALLLLVPRWLRRRRVTQNDGLSLGQTAAKALDFATELGNGTPTVGHLLIALASVPGRQIKLLRREHRLVAAAARQQLGIARGRDELFLLIDRPALACRRVEARLKSGRVPARAGYYAMRVLGVLWAIFVFALDTFATIMLYVFLWPGLLVLNGIRVLTAFAVGLDFKVRRAHEIPGGEIEPRTEARLSDVRIALAVLLPRVLCFTICVLSFLLLFWQTSRIGVYPFQITVARYDVLGGDASVIVAPVIVFFDAWHVHGLALGTGILAGVGAGVLSVPSFREIELVRMAGAHDVGGGSPVVRVIAAPLLVVTAVFAFFEAILPFRGGPLYLSMYAIPLLMAALVSVPLRLLLPY